MRISNVISFAVLGSLLPLGALACGDRPGLVRTLIAPGARAAANLQVLSQPETPSPGNEDSLDTNSEHHKPRIVGTWVADWFVGSTSKLYDRVITVVYADGNETENDIAVPPSTENVCYGVWEQTGRDTFKMRHFGWVFDVNGVFMGNVEVIVTVCLTDHGTSFRGKYVLDQYDVDRNVIPADHAEGDIRATRYTLANGIQH